ncbi:hypothetical protein N7447_006414 [Penicillium robsamsonii]|uniref:uncharacterized protein n=1 Tax=Penicillium robsamsonii TaxID=1792511 RepID=UPI002546BC43|nr:uncharacterized protein N7447_006414 [Penicillium robsamsonii]KAJ5824074.1 hypothetical protein N7447_006414 [Penicillium robsamsonii]
MFTDDIRRDTSLSNEFPTANRRPGISQYRLIEDVEDLDICNLGGYHPLQVGDELDNARYGVIDKLGYGGYSTIWLARGIQIARYVAVKVITAANDYTREASVISSLGNAPSTPGKEVIPPLIDQFWIYGPNGKHRCFGLFRPKVAQSIIAQFARVFIPDWFGISSDGVDFGEERIILSDSNSPQKTLPLQPPEARFSDEPLSFASDIWTLACTIWETAGQRSLFGTFFPAADRVTAEQVEVLGILSPEWLEKWSTRLDWFNEDGELNELECLCIGP